MTRGPVGRFSRPTASFSPKGTSFSEEAASLSPGARREFAHVKQASSSASMRTPLLTPATPSSNCDEKVHSSLNINVLEIF